MEQNREISVRSYPSGTVRFDKSEQPWRSLWFGTLENLGGQRRWGPRELHPANGLTKLKGH
eukprot:3329709-Pyramimonas_sp.AAC.1